ncbi:lactococcin 972 family bacteriocin [Nocardiopsis sp. CNT312]|uniref:lactococcin 972 family bacteriocin n=1 Tax=Nocardiopsis sp. CNT312 TaxID=1137268 RepID=UPI00048ED44E|nr:lactococcin 972 family bacteriocin [Nocardiopsis sp. CNT312]
MKLLKKAAVTLLIGAGVGLGAAGIASAATSYVGGGTWSHGVTKTTVYSIYHHSTRCHGATAVGTYTDRTPSTLPGYTAQAYAPPRWWGGNEAYWNLC